MRLFLALVPPPALRRRFGELADTAHAHCSGRRVPDDNLHLTLAFLGEQPERRAEQLADWLSGIRVAPGQWRLDRWGHFAGPGIVWIGGEPESELVQLQQSLREELEDIGIASQPRRFTPHVTLLRRAEQPPEPSLPDFAEDWSYTRAALVLSEPTGQGSRYTPLAWSRV
ncbi:RNA 2',3'-cyclic phosphodiesterase [Halomonas elongata]|uniref:RNA 2',3'-cyclic phosphodiesterase n=1 Tax=Halomonas elongata (strain ATCC 33173 / DSM 2581 / NBRC 15536 / NCIMB 2198 / 1H9) TaxID=768066 RepID=E1VCC1_HALED|nr:RNA 2',3'-cyclic phosphodiesterase [Halomonas elongata]WBF18060.1 RNA 2',3'-cyclic phosphodiesterase [Halomonas elongata]WPU46910.1 RNA 2',3'-cyclic phosphodiesterase [Halomonas elongata DSM 2581]CBV44291.1 RNA 2',3'-cyclic phosphodiesterase [Halomonas elongata DSM 2581]